jgi:hypothetical protein
MPIASAYKTNRGSINVAAKTLVTTKKRIGFVDETSMASICSVTFIEPNSAPMPEPTFRHKSSCYYRPNFPYQRNGYHAWEKGNRTKIFKYGRDCMVKHQPHYAPVIEIKGSDL